MIAPGKNTTKTSNLSKIKIRGTQKLTAAKGVSSTTVHRAIVGQWVPAEILGPQLRQPRDRKQLSGLYLEGISAADWARRKRVIPEKTLEISTSTVASRRESSKSVDLDQFRAELQDQEQDDEANIEEAEVDLEELERQRIREEAEEAERFAKEQLEQAELELNEMTEEGLETAKRLAALESLITQAIDDNSTDAGSEHDDDEENEVEGYNGHTATESRWQKMGKKASRFTDEKRAADKALDQLISKELKEKLKGGGMFHDDFVSFMTERKLLAGTGGTLTMDDVTKAFERAQKPIDKCLYDQ